jgi:hypothetical protein
MSAQDVYSQLANERKSLLDKICENEELASVIMGLLARLVYVCEHDKGMPVTGMKMDAWSCDDSTFKSRVHFSPLAHSKPLLWGAHSDFSRYARAKAGNLARALSDNPKLEESFQSLVEAISQHAEHKGIPFPALCFTEHIITMDNVIVLKVARRPSAE